ncbi:MAG: cell wall-binding repeat-containing protein [Tissierellia bacterium]|nr:cell wall-binding repeat-containing protein [Tissierellia bacterium]
MNKTFFKKLLISHLLICMCFISIFIIYGYSENLDEDIKPQTINRVSGKTRYETAANLSRKFTEADNIILVSGEDFPDALVSSSIAFSLKAPILLTSKDNIPNETLEEINRLNPTNIYIVGGEGSIHSESLKSLDKNLIRISGEDRFETSEKVAEKAIELGLSNDTLIVTGGLSYPDALSSSNLVKDKNSPLVLVRNNLPEIAKDKNLIAVGGIKNMELENFNGEIISGKDRYETSVRVLQ